MTRAAFIGGYRTRLIACFYFFQSNRFIIFASAYLIGMAEKEDLKKKKIKALLLNLGSKEEKKQLEAVKALKVNGDETVIGPLIEVLVNTKSDKLKAEISDLLNTIKSTSVPPEIAKCLMDSSLAPAHQIILSSIWNSGLDYRSYLKEIISATLQGDLMTAIECITIIENQEDLFTEEQLFEPILLLKEYLVTNRESTDPKMKILMEITSILQEMNNNL